ncbi:FG-GAP-like repeat-containing protein [Silvibacterium acidisoli]|uniref:FG-GAP-like repeat-containing protein n=1 Tax=Acidobacteriaceae bacterium ZG23-2 TaxID=2883246 RepID=UPI00406C2BE0
MLAAFAAIATLALAPTHKAHAATATHTTLAISPATPQKTGTAITLTAAVTDATGTAVENGEVDFYDGKSLIGTSPVITQGTVGKPGSAVYPLVPGPGPHSFTATYRTTLTEITSTSDAQSFSVTSSLPTTTALKATADGNGTYSLQATLSANGPVTPTGSFHFLDVSKGNSTITSVDLGNATTTFSFKASGSQSGSGSYTSAAEADFNQDGIPDIAVFSSSGAVQVFNGDGTGKFAASQFSDTFPGGIAAAAVQDFNGDGLPDIALIGQQGLLIVLTAEAGGSFTVADYTQLPTSYAADKVLVGDFNGDGLLDLAVHLPIRAQGSGPSNSSQLVILTGTGQGQFSIAGEQQINGQNTLLATQDLNGDGIDDLVIGNGNNTITVYTGQSSGAPTAGTPLTVASDTTFIVQAAAFGDFNGDGHADLAVSGSDTAASTAAVYVMTGDGNGGLTASGTAYPVTLDPERLVVADVNNDHIPDFVTANFSDASLNIYIGDGKGSFTQRSDSPVSHDLGAASGNTLEVFPADANGDGLMDLTVVNISQSTVNTLLNQATFTVPGSATGIAIDPQEQVAAAYSGDSVYAASTSTSYTAPAAAPASTTLTLGVTPAQGATTTTSLSLTATLSPATLNGATATGTITFSDGSTVLGTAPLTGGVATFTAKPLTAGNHSLTASYSGDANFAGSTAPAVTISIATPAAADFALAATPSSATVSAGQPANYQLSVTPANGFDQAVTFACAGLPAGTACVFNPASVTPSSAAATTALTITTTGSATTAASLSRTFTGGIAFAVLGLFVLPYSFRQNGYRYRLMLVACVLMSGAIVGCGSKANSGPAGTIGTGGGTGSGGGTGGGSASGTPAGTSTVTVTATSGTISHTAQITLVVQ